MPYFGHRTFIEHNKKVNTEMALQKIIYFSAIKSQASVCTFEICDHLWENPANVARQNSGPCDNLKITTTFC
jgi:hypothetical protein